MVEFNSEIPKGRPQLAPDYWEKQNNPEQKPNTIYDLNTNIALKDISIFKNEQK